MYLTSQASMAMVVTPLAAPLHLAIDINDRDDILAFSIDLNRYYILKRVRS